MPLQVVYCHQPTFLELHHEFLPVQKGSAQERAAAGCQNAHLAFPSTPDNRGGMDGYRYRAVIGQIRWRIMQEGQSQGGNGSGRQGQKVR